MKYGIGTLIKKLRIEKGMSQEELAAGICTQSALSKLEAGEKMLRPDTIAALLQFLGVSDSNISLMVRDKDIVNYNDRFKLRQAYISRDFGLVERILTKNKNNLNKLSPYARQTYETIDVLLRDGKGEFSTWEAICRLESVIRLTHSDYSLENLPMFLTYEDILLLNNIAVKYAKMDKTDLSIKILYHIKNFYDIQVCDIEEALRTKPMILYNLSKFLGLAGQIDESIDISIQGIKLARETGRCSHLSKTLYNLAYGLYERNQPGDREASKYYGELALKQAEVMNNRILAEHCKIFLTARFDESNNSL